MPARILIVDDDPDMVELLQLALNEAGYSTCAAYTGRDALTAARRLSPDLVILDLLLPDLNGLTVCENLRRRPATASLPIIMITVMPGRFPRMAGAELGANAYINKPFPTQELVACVTDLLHGSAKIFPLADAPWRVAA